MSSTAAMLYSVTEDTRGGALAVRLDIQVKIFDMTIRVIHESWHTPLKRKKDVAGTWLKKKQVGTLF